MNTLHTNPHLRRVFTFVALVATLGLSAVGITQCRMIDDTVTGVDGRSAGAFHGDDDYSDDDWKDNDRNDKGGHRRKCKAKCNDKYKDCRKQEEARFRSALRQCDRLNTRQKRQACKDAEERKHLKAWLECVKQRLICKKNCNYREGGGVGGR